MVSQFSLQSKTKYRRNCKLKSFLIIVLNNRRLLEYNYYLNESTEIMLRQHLISITSWSRICLFACFLLFLPHFIIAIF